ncbi:hypothetical protein S40285_08772 [Stachybotrys chlorohalonatus IBT 40285]|uniref:FAD-binding PCMH-type domain-containing protein n=1 Tax=Stachybotrys chlorohalonatus (strain IBT 40285) TaxID=1283841 RepID=A0A084QXE4_STAC4|nr:hypothetical protein S40285_08772 [Stachybotrys chlorohalonata IBT 40285]
MARLAVLALALLAGSATAVPTSSLRCRNTTSAWPEALAGKVYDRSWPNFVNATTRWSTHMAPTFYEVFLPETIEDLSIGLSYLSTTDKQWLAMSGGHGYSPTLGAVQNGTLINMRNFQYSYVNNDFTMTVGSGSKFRDMVNTAAASGREVNVGNCPCVGGLGATLGGGLGRLQGLRGLTSDALTAVRMVLWNGTIIEASEESHADLFWGLRGAGQNFGIIAEADYRTWPLTNGGMHYSADMIFDRSNLSTLIETSNALLPLDARLALQHSYFYDVANSRLMIGLNVIYAGPMEEGQVYSSLFRPHSQLFVEQQIHWTGLNDAALFGGIANGCTPGEPTNQRNIMTRDLHPEHFLELIDSLVEMVQANPTANGSAIMIETFPVQAVDAQPTDYTAFPHRNAFANAIVFHAEYLDAAGDVASNAWASEWRDRWYSPEYSGYNEQHVYQNYANEDEPLSALYGTEPWRQQRLSSLKASYDPHGFFSNWHAIPASADEWA